MSVSDSAAERGPPDRGAGEPPCYTSDENTAKEKGDRSARRHTHVLEMVTLHPGPCGLVGVGEKLSCLPL